MDGDKSPEGEMNTKEVGMEKLAPDSPEYRKKGQQEAQSFVRKLEERVVSKHAPGQEPADYLTEDITQQVPGATKPEFSPEHPYGPSGKLPKPEIKSGEIVNLLSTEIPPGLDWPSFDQWTRDRIVRAEVTNEFAGGVIDQAGEYKNVFIDQFREAMNNYNINITRVLPPDLPEKIRDLVFLMEIRGTLSNAEDDLLNFNYKYFNAIVSRYLSDMNGEDRLKVFWNDQLGLPPAAVPENPIQKLAAIMEEREVAGDPFTAGAYWREFEVPALDPLTRLPIQDPANPANIKMDYPPGSKHKQVEAYLAATFPTNEAKRKEAKRIVESLFDLMGMSALYTGPVLQEPTSGNWHLIDLEIMDRVDPRITGNLPPRLGQKEVPSYIVANPLRNPGINFMLNENYWDKWAEFRRRQGVPSFPRMPNYDTIWASPTSGTMLGVGSIGDPAALRRLMYTPEEIERLGVTKARSLRYAMESYFRPLPVANGYKTLADYMSGPKPWYPFRHGMYAENAGSLIGAATRVLLEPIAGNEQAGDPRQIGDQLKSLLEVIGSFDKYLKLGGINNVLYYATSRLMEATFRYINGRSPDRVREFPHWPILGPQTLNLFIRNSAFNQLLDDEKREWVLKELGTTTGRVAVFGFLRELFGLAGDIGKGAASK